MQGRIVAYDGAILTVKVPFCDTNQMIKKGIRTAQVMLEDGRHISSDQRKKIS